MAPQVLKSETVFRGRAFAVRLDELEYAPGRSTRIEVVEHSGAVTMVPLDDHGQLWFIRQYRHPAGQELLELPAGTLEPGEDPAAGAARELQEEIGMRAGRLDALASFWLAPGYSTERMHVYLAGALEPAPLPPDEDEVISVVKLPVAAALAAAARGEIQDATSLAALFAAGRRLGW